MLSIFKCAYSVKLDVIRQTFAKIIDVLWELQVCTAQGRGEKVNRFLEGSMEARDVTEHRVSQQLCRGWPGEYTQRLNACKSKISIL